MSKNTSQVSFFINKKIIINENLKKNSKDTTHELLTYKVFVIRGENVDVKELQK